MRRALGILLVIAGPVVVAAGYLRLPSASTCAMDNGIALDLGKSATCSTSPSPLYYVAGAVLLVVGLLILMPWSRWLTGAN
ncbi:MAG: hypothetical protein ACRDP7_15555 [Trebonia sp.]